MGNSIVLDVGKTMSKLSLWSAKGCLLARETRVNERVQGPGYAALDSAGITEWLIETLREFARHETIQAIIPVGHGAAAAIVRNGSLLFPPMDYEQPIACGERKIYEQDRDSFLDTGSPALPDGLNLGAQLHHLDTKSPLSLRGATILLWPQYWAWVLSGVEASELTSLGCHTDLWLPLEKRPSTLAVKRGWAAMIPPLRRAAETLGPIRRDIAARTGLPPQTRIHCGLHDSNAALIAARGFPEIADHEATVLSTGTWFVAMRTPAAGASVDIACLAEDRDCLMNVDAFGRPLPSSRFMGGREIEILTGTDIGRIDMEPDQPELVAAVATMIERGSMVLPTFAAGCGPYGKSRGRWIAMPIDRAERRAAIGLYGALVANSSLDLIGSRERLLVEGRFAKADVLVRALASLRPETRVYVANAHNDVSFGALRLLDPSLQPGSSLELVKPLELRLNQYHAQWRSLAEQMEDE